MNIFYLDKNPWKCAMYHCDKHVCKMILESAQMLSTAHHLLSYEKREPSELFKKAFVNHPSTKWARETSANYNYLFQLAWGLCSEYEFRYGKTHSTAYLIKYVMCIYPDKIPNADMTPIPQCMPEDVKGEDSVEAYRNYYRVYKRRFAKWKKRDIPEWFNEKETPK